jgi:hypothetical protein
MWMTSVLHANKKTLLKFLDGLSIKENSLLFLHGEAELYNTDVFASIHSDRIGRRSGGWRP